MVGPAAVGMGKAPRAPRNAAPPPPSCKIQLVLQQLLEPQQCASGLQNGDADAAPVAARYVARIRIRVTVSEGYGYADTPIS
jgi:hypothetical protein